MTTLREAAQQALKALEMLGYPLAAITSLRAALAQQEQEPVAWRYKGMMGMPWSLSDDGYYVSCKRDKGYVIEPLYTAPPRREWQSLSKDDALKLWGMRSDGPSNLEIIGFARAVEALLKEKNHG